MLLTDIALSCNGHPAITLSIKPASSRTAAIKKLAVVFKDDVPRPGEVEVISDAYPTKVRELHEINNIGLHPPPPP